MSISKKYFIDKLQLQLYDACKQGNVAVVDQLLHDKRIDPTDDDNYPLRVACDKGHIDVVKILLKDKRVDPSSRDCEVIKYAIHDKRMDIVDLLVNGVCNYTEEYKNTAIAAAVYYTEGDDMEFVNPFLKSKHFNPCGLENRALFATLEDRKYNIFRFLLSDDRFDASADNNKLIQEVVDCCDGNHLYDEKCLYNEFLKVLLQWQGKNGEKVDIHVDDDSLMKLVNEHQCPFMLKTLTDNGNF